MSSRKEIDITLNFANINNERISNCDDPDYFTGQNVDLTAETN